MVTLWQNGTATVFKTEGYLRPGAVRSVEPTGRDYTSSLPFRPRARQRGTMYGNPSSGETFPAFYGATVYDELVITSLSGRREVVPDVVVVEKLKPYLQGNRLLRCYFIAEIAGDAANLLFALKREHEEQEDLDGVGSIYDRTISSLRRQLAAVAIPAIGSILLFSAIVLAMLAGVFGPGVYGLFAVLLVILGAFLMVGMYLLKRRLQLFPSRKILEEILQRDGFTIVDYRLSRGVP